MLTINNTNRIHAGIVICSSLTLVLVVGCPVATQAPPEQNPTGMSSASGTWDTFGEGTDSDIFTVRQTANGDLIAAGQFEFAGARPVNRIARWDGSNWNAMAAGFDDAVNTITVSSDDRIFAGTQAPDRRVYEWNGTTWNTLLDGPPDANELLDLDFDSDGNLLAAGRYWLNPHSRMMSWNGSEWSEFGPIEEGACCPGIRDLAVDNNGVIYAAFDRSVPNQNQVVRWTGSAWENVGGEMNGLINALEFDGMGNLYAGGEFTRVGDTIAGSVARWDGNTWHAVGDGVTSTLNNVYTIAYDDVRDILYIGGDFEEIAGQPARSFAYWDGTSWDAPNRGPFGATWSLAIDDAGSVYVAGNFFLLRSVDDTREDIIANNIARWNP